MAFFYIFFLFYFTTIHAKHTCSSCCFPDEPARYLPFEFFVPASLLLSLLIYHWAKSLKFEYSKYKRNSLDGAHKFYGKLPTQGTYQYKGHSSRSTSFCKECVWNTEGSISLTFEDIHLTFQQYDNPDFNREGMIQENRLVNLDRGDPNNDLHLYITQIPGQETPGFMGFRGEKNDLWVMFPQEYEYEICSLFPYMNNNFLRVYFGLILIFSFLCLITYYKIHGMDIYYDYYFDNLGCPWGAICSFVGLIVFFIYTNPFGYLLTSSNNIRFPILFGFYCGIIVLCISFSIVDLSTADFIKTESMIDTHVNNDMEREEFGDSCRFNEYDCSVYWSANLTNRNENCLDSYYLLCISFNAVGNSCIAGNKDIYNIFLIQGMFQFFLAIIWIISAVTIADIYSNDRWSTVSPKLEEWNQPLNEEHKEN